ncbi:MAG TPA: aldose epimerase [Cellulomonas sp.]
MPTQRPADRPTGRQPAQAAAPVDQVGPVGPVGPLGHGVVVLRSDAWEVGVLPGTGASVAYGRILTSAGWVDLLRPTPAHARTSWARSASFPLVPWSNRIDGGVLPFRGRTWQLARTAEDGTALHGVGAGYPWRVTDRTVGSVVLDLDSEDLTGVNFPWRFRSRIVYALRGPSLVVTTTVENADVEPFPAGFGHHPYLRRYLAAPTGEDGPLLHVPASRGYALDRAMATGPAGAIPARADFRSARPVGTVFVDDVLTGLDPAVLARVVYPEAEVTFTADPVYSHAVVYAPRRRPYLAIEPVTHVNGGFALHDAGVPGTGVLVLEPGESTSGTFTVRIEA